MNHAARVSRRGAVSNIANRITTLDKRLISPHSCAMGKFCLPFVCAFLAALSAASAAEPIQGIASVIDGDTIEIHGQHIRLTGIDAPESSQFCERGGKRYRCGQEAAFALSGEAGARTVTCLPSGTDRYHRVLAQCSFGGVNLNRWMVQQGYAVAYRRYSTAYVADEDAAKAAKRGIWAGFL